MSNYSDELINNYNCPDCNEAKLQSDKNTRKINEVIDQVNALIQVNNGTVDFIEEKANEVVGEVVEIKVNELTEKIKTYFLTDIKEINTIISKMNDGDILNCNGTYDVDTPIFIDKNITVNNGIFKYKQNNALRLFNINSPCRLYNITIDGNKAEQSGDNHYLYDMVVISDTSKVIIENCNLQNSYGGGICIYRSSNCIIKNNIIEGSYDNGILLAEKGSNNNIIECNIINGTDSQNCIFLTSSASSQENNECIFNNKVINNICTGASDTSIEAGLNTENTLIIGNHVEVVNHAGILMRDSKRFLVTNNIIKQLNSGSDDSISVVPHYKGSGFECDGIIENNRIFGDVIRSQIGVFQNNVIIRNNLLKYDNELISSDGSNLKGTGILSAGNSGLVLDNNVISNFDNGIYLNYGDFTPSIKNITIRNNKIEVTKKAINLWNCTLINGSIDNNKLINCFDNAIKDGHGSKTTSMNNNTVYSDMSVRYQHTEIPNNTFIDRTFLKTLVLPKALYNTTTLFKLNGEHIGKCTISGLSSTNNVYATFDILNNQISYRYGHLIGVNDSDQWKLIVNNGEVQIQNRGETSADIYVCLKFVLN